MELIQNQKESIMKISAAIFLVLTAFASTSALAGECEVTVTWPGGNGKSGVRVVGEVSGFGGMTKTFHTGSNGKVVVTWSSSNKLKEVFVSGSRTGWECHDGGSVTVTAR